MEFIEDLSKEEYENFVSNNKYNHFMQSYDFGQIRKIKHFIPHYVGIKQDGKIVCAALLLEKKLIMNYCYLYSPRGYVIDFNDKELVLTFTNYLKKFAKKIKALFIKIDPAIKLHTLDIDGNVIDGENNEKIVDDLKNMGYEHLGFNLGFEHEQPRFTFRVDLNKKWEDVYNNMHPTTKKILNKGNQYNLKIYKGNENDIEDFYLTMIETAKREQLTQYPIDYYKLFYKTFNKDNLSDLYIIKVNIKELIKTFEDKIESVNKEIDELSSEKYKNKNKAQNKITDLNNQINKLNKELEEIKEIKEEELILSSIITVKYKDKVWTVHGGNNSKLMNLNANYLLYYTIMKDAYDEGFKCLDCFGTCGIANPDKSNPIYGIHLFKKRLGGEYVEFIGEFNLITNKIMYSFYKKLIPIYRKIKKIK